MTYIQKAMEVHPELSQDELVLYYCPFEVFNLDDSDGHCLTHGGGPIEVTCPVCWNREYQNEEVIW